MIRPNRQCLLGMLIGVGVAATLALAAADARAESFEREAKRAGARHFHPERGEVSLQDLRAFSGVRQFAPAHAGLPLDPHLSIFVTDVETVSQLKLSEVLDKLVADSGDKTLNKQTLFRQWWDTAGQGPGLGWGPHCDDDSPPLPASAIAANAALSTLNKFPYRCPRLEVAEAASDPFTDESDANPNAYSAIAYSNRFDLISKPAQITDPSTGRTRKVWPDCGEYRVVFARNSGKTDPLNRNLIIFEARVPNPHPSAGDADAGPVGCHAILSFWHGLSDRSMTAKKRGELLKAFYLHGLPADRQHKKDGRPEVGPVVDAANYTFNAGQIRTNQFMLNKVAAGQQIPIPQPADWTLREFKTDLINGTLAIVPDSVKSNPANVLFTAAAAGDPRTAALNQSIRGQTANLLGGGGAGKGLADVNSIGFNTGGEGVNTFESDEHDASLGDISVAFTEVAGPNPTVATNIKMDLDLAAHNSGLTSLNLIARMKTQTCAGCHHWSDPGKGVLPVANVNTELGGGAEWPAKAGGDAAHPTHGLTHPPMDFTQESEQTKDLQPAISDPTKKRYATSLTVEKFLEFREAFMVAGLGLPQSEHIPQTMEHGR